MTATRRREGADIGADIGEMSARIRWQQDGGPVRLRILEAMLTIVAERGFARTTVRAVAARAGVSTATFYMQFDGLEDCFTAVLDLGLEHASNLIVQAFEGERKWQDGVRVALASLLVYLDSEPVFTRAWFIDSLAAGEWALQRRERNTALLRAMIVEPWHISSQQPPEPASIVGVMASVFGLIHTHLITRQPGPLIGLLGPLVELVVARFLDSSAAESEVERAVQLACVIQAGADPRWPPPRESTRALEANAPFEATYPMLPAVLGGRRARECVLFLASHPGASNRELAAGIGVAHKSHMSRLVAGLSKAGLAVKCSEGAGKRNAWRLTPFGEEMAHALLEQGACGRMSTLSPNRR